MLENSRHRDREYAWNNTTLTSPDQEVKSQAV
jgi:hypothetical protein